MGDNDLVTGPTAGQYDVWARVAGLGIVAGLVLGIVPWLFGATGTPVVVTVAVLMVVPGLLSTYFSLQSLAVAKRERAAGYSTMYDFAGFELRDPRTRELLRARDVAPSGTVRRSMLRSMLTVKPGTMLAQRLEDDEKADPTR
jgi:hypothetical protein